jgi:hypothetical protein
MNRQFFAAKGDETRTPQEAAMKRFWLFICSAMVLSSGAKASAAPPTFWDNSSAHNIGRTTASLILTPKDSGLPMRAWIEYSTNSNLSGAEKVGERLTTSTPSQIHAALTGLKPNTTYYFRGFARNADGESETPIQKFTTLAQAQLPMVEFGGNPTYGAKELSIPFVCKGNGEEADCVAMWSTSPSMSGERELTRRHVSGGIGSMMHGPFPLSSVPDNTKIYVQGTIKNAVGKAQTPVKEILIRNKPI